MFKGLQNGYELPNEISEEEYKHIRTHKDEDMALTGFVGFACSFGGRWFKGYARDRTNRNYCFQGKRSLLKNIETFKNMSFICHDYKDVELPINSVIYADPPYANTTQYDNKIFDSDAFWEYARKVSQSHIMFISEQVAPDDFVCIWSKPLKRTLDVNKNNQFTVTEKLFVHKCNAHLFQ